mmetsp:Transcript_14105/g.16832  ORF Transcript_14105/g.16832 Transcript_14105/m.16832 type:complete len:91 (+) Transcript_14105:25-297(+)
MVLPGLRQHTKLISQLGSVGTWTKVLQLLSKMRSLRLEPNVITYNSSIHACGQSSMWQQSLALLRRMEKAELQPDIISYNTTISSCELPL